MTGFQHETIITSNFLITNIIFTLTYPCINNSLFSVMNLHWWICMYWPYWQEIKLIFISIYQTELIFTINTIRSKSNIWNFRASILCDINGIVIFSFKIKNLQITCFTIRLFPCYCYSSFFCKQSTFSIICKISFDLWETEFQKQTMIVRSIRTKKTHMSCWRWTIEDSMMKSVIYFVTISITSKTTMARWIINWIAQNISNDHQNNKYVVVKHILDFCFSIIDWKLSNIFIVYIHVRNQRINSESHVFHFQGYSLINIVFNQRIPRLFL